MKASLPHSAPFFYLAWIAVALLPIAARAQPAAPGASDADAAHGAIIDKTPESGLRNRADAPAHRETERDDSAGRQVLPDADQRHDTSPDHDASGRLAVPQPERSGVPGASPVPQAPATTDAPEASPGPSRPGSGTESEPSR